METRTKDFIVPVIVFCLLVIFVFNLAIETTPLLIGLVAPGILWVAFTLGGILGLTRSFSLEKENGNLSSLLVAPIGRDSIFFGKMLANFSFMLLVELVLFPIFAALFNIPLVSLTLIPIAILTTLGISTIGTLFSAMAIHTRAREIMLPLLFLPIAVPILIAAVETTGSIITNSNPDNIKLWIPFLGALDAIFLVICPPAFYLLVEE